MFGCPGSSLGAGDVLLPVVSAGPSSDPCTCGPQWLTFRPPGDRLPHDCHTSFQGIFAKLQLWVGPWQWRASCLGASCLDRSSTPNLTRVSYLSFSTITHLPTRLGRPKRKNTIDIPRCRLAPSTPELISPRPWPLLTSLRHICRHPMLMLCADVRFFSALVFGR